MMTDFRPSAGAAIAAALLVAACGSDDLANRSADNALDNASFGNAADPSAIETIGNGGSAGSVEASGVDRSSGAAPAPPGPANGTQETDPNPPAGRDSTDVGGDMGGNTAGGTGNRM